MTTCGRLSSACTAGTGCSRSATATRTSQPSGSQRYFERALAARDAGMLKPDPRIFALLLERAGLDAARALHVGDDAVADVEGARRAGVTPVWLNRSGVRWPVAVSPPPLTVRTLLELAELLE